MPSLAAEEEGEQGEVGEQEEGALVTGGTHEEEEGDLSTVVTGTLEGVELGVLEVMLDCSNICCREANGKFGG